MTLDAVYTLEDAFDEALRETTNGSTRMVIRWLQLHKRKVLDDNALTIEATGLNNLIRAFRKKREGRDVVSSKVQSLCLDLGLETLDLDDEVSVPADETNLLYGECEWKDLDDLTLQDIDLHIELLEAETKAVQEKTANYRILRQAAAKIVPSRNDIPLRVLRQIAREQNG